MSLLDTASLLVTPNAYKASKLYSVIPSNGSGDMSVTRATTATRVNSAGLVESVAIDVPRLDYSNGSCPSLLVEPQRTNLLTYSEQIDNVAWNKLNATISANAATAPDGTLTADLIYPTTTGTERLIEQAPAATNGQTYTSSFFVKSAGFNWVLVYSPNLGACWFNASTGALGTVAANVTATVLGQINGFWRVSFTGTIASSNTYFYAGPTDANGSITATKSGTNGLLIWGAQLELGSYPTSYIPTTTASVTRNADVISKTGITSLIGQTEGTLFAEIEVSKLIGAASRYIFHISDGTANNRIYMAFSGSSSNVLRGRVFNGGTLQCSIDTSTITTTGTYKLALAYKNNDIVFYVNGVQIGVDTSATIPTCSRVDVGQNYANVSQLSDGIKASTLWKTRLTNTQLAQLTTI